MAYLQDDLLILSQFRKTNPYVIDQSKVDAETGTIAQKFIKAVVKGIDAGNQDFKIFVDLSDSVNSTIANFGSIDNNGSTVFSQTKLDAIHSLEFGDGIHEITIPGQAFSSETARYEIGLFLSLSNLKSLIINENVNVNNSAFSSNSSHNNFVNIETLIIGGLTEIAPFAGVLSAGTMPKLQNLIFLSTANLTATPITSESFKTFGRQTFGSASITTNILVVGKNPQHLMLTKPMLSDHFSLPQNHISSKFNQFIASKLAGNQLVQDQPTTVLHDFQNDSYGDESLLPVINYIEDDNKILEQFQNQNAFVIDETLMLSNTNITLETAIIDATIVGHTKFKILIDVPQNFFQNATNQPTLSTALSKITYFEFGDNNTAIRIEPDSFFQNLTQPNQFSFWKNLEILILHRRVTVNTQSFSILSGPSEPFKDLFPKLKTFVFGGIVNGSFLFGNQATSSSAKAPRLSRFVFLSTTTFITSIDGFKKFQLGSEHITTQILVVGKNGQHLIPDLKFSDIFDTQTSGHVSSQFENFISSELIDNQLKTTTGSILHNFTDGSYGKNLLVTYLDQDIVTLNRFRSTFTIDIDVVTAAGSLEQAITTAVNNGIFALQILVNIPNNFFLSGNIARSILDQIQHLEIGDGINPITVGANAFQSFPAPVITFNKLKRLIVNNFVTMEIFCFGDSQFPSLQTLINGGFFDNQQQYGSGFVIAMPKLEIFILLSTTTFENSFHFRKIHMGSPTTTTKILVLGKDNQHIISGAAFLNVGGGNFDGCVTTYLSQKFKDLLKSYIQGNRLLEIEVTSLNPLAFVETGKILHDFIHGPYGDEVPTIEANQEFIVHSNPKVGDFVGAIHGTDPG